MVGNLNSLTVLRNILNDGVFSRFAHSDKDEGAFAEFVHSFYERKNFKDCGQDFYEYVLKLALYDDNVFARTSASGKKVPDLIYKAYLGDLKAILTSLSAVDPHGYYLCDVKCGITEKNLTELMIKWVALYRKSGYGKFLYSNVFRLSGVGLVPVAAEAVDLKSLKDYYQ